MSDYLLGVIVGLVLGVISTLIGVFLEERLHRQGGDDAPHR